MPIPWRTPACWSPFAKPFAKAGFDRIPVKPRCPVRHLIKKYHRTQKAFMSPIPSSHTQDTEPGQLLNELERRQDDVLKQLDDLEDQLNEVLKGLGVAAEDEVENDLA
jgi:hypothetical protein